MGVLKEILKKCFFGTTCIVFQTFIHSLVCHPSRNTFTISWEVSRLQLISHEIKTYFFDFILIVFLFNFVPSWMFWCYLLISPPDLKLHGFVTFKQTISHYSYMMTWFQYCIYFPLSTCTVHINYMFELNTILTIHIQECHVSIST